MPKTDGNIKTLRRINLYKIKTYPDKKERILLTFSLKNNIIFGVNGIFMSYGI